MRIFVNLSSSLSCSVSEPLQLSNSFYEHGSPTPYSSLHQTLLVTQCSQGSAVLGTVKARFFLWIARQRDMTRHSREHVSTALESLGAVLYTTASDAMHCSW
ncbi:hypothetical protein XENOCAPTIV_029236 [Xenoophorus captivus]|uniref:Secreted protein n=1 Tax=Xenoophorus captivus TaxID=1517983 RepID=A0ABV0QNN7_9TELE